MRQLVSCALHLTATCILGAGAAPLAEAEPTFTGFRDLVGPSFKGSIYDVSADGSVVVGEFKPSYFDRAFRWTSETGLSDLGYPTGEGPTSEGKAVSADGLVVVGRANGAFRWTSEGGAVGLGDLPEGRPSLFAVAPPLTDRSSWGPSNPPRAARPSAGMSDQTASLTRPTM